MADAREQKCKIGWETRLLTITITEICSSLLSCRDECSDPFPKRQDPLCVGVRVKQQRSTYGVQGLHGSKLIAM